MATVQDMKIMLADQLLVIYDMRVEIERAKTTIIALNAKLKEKENAGSFDRSTDGDDKTPGLHNQRGPDAPG